MTLMEICFRILLFLAKNIVELLLLLYKVVVLHLSCLGPLYVMGTYQEYEDQHKTEFIVDKLIYGGRGGIPL